MKYFKCKLKLTSKKKKTLSGDLAPKKNYMKNTSHNIIYEVKKVYGFFQVKTQKIYFFSIVYK